MNLWAVDISKTFDSL